MHVLVAGEMQVIDIDGVWLANLTPITTVGEMGLIRHEKRSAEVVATMPSTTLQIGRLPFEQLLNHDLQLKIRIYANVIDILSNKIINDNLRTIDAQENRTTSQLAIHKLHKQLDFALSVIDDTAEAAKSEVLSQFGEQLIGEVTILFVDDEENIHSSVRRLLRDQSCRPLFAENGETALELLQQYKVDMVVTDIRMQPMDGFSLAEEIGLRFPDLPVVAFSAMINAEDIKGHNFNDFIDKPFDMADFRRMVDTILSKDM